MRELTELTAAELDIVSGGVSAAAATGPNDAGAAAAGSLGVTVVFPGIPLRGQISTVNATGLGPANDVAIAGAT